MRRAFRYLLVLAALVLVGVGSYWLGHRHQAPATSSDAAEATSSADDPIVYYQDPDGRPFYSAAPKETEDGRSYRPVHASEDVNFAGDAPTTAADQTERRILYYRNPMGLPDISETPKKDSMGMDYIPVYEGEDDGADGTITLTPVKIQRIGVASEEVAPRVISESVRAPGTLQLDERRISVISLRAEAFVEVVEDVTTGSEVREGQPLMRLYSPAIASVAAEYVAQLRDGASIRQGAKQRLLNLAVPPALIEEIERTREVPLSFVWPAPRDGIVLERNIVDGMRVMPEDVLFRVADHSVMWALVDVAERDLPAVEVGQPATIQLRSYPGKSFPGKVALVYPHLNPETRTVRVRLELPNQKFLFRPDMYAEARIDTGTSVPVLAVPDSAVIDSGDRQVVIVDKGEGRFEPRAVTLGISGSGYTEIAAGVAEGERVVTSANFLIDAESNLKAALDAMRDAVVAP